MKNEFLKKTFFKAASAVLAVLSIGMGTVGCGSSEARRGADDTVKIIASNFALYDFARLYEADGVEAEMLISPGSESHDLEATISDLSAIGDADIFVFAGGESDLWVNSVFESLGEAGESVIRINALELITGESGELHEHDHGEHNHESADEHVWTAIPNALALIDAIGDAVRQADETKYFPDAAEDYAAKLTELDKAYRSMVSSAKRKEIAVCDRFPFTHMAGEYGIAYSAAFEGCTSNVEVPLSVINEMITEVKEKAIPAVFYIEFSDRTAADAVCAETGAVPLLLHSCHNVTKADLDKGVTYLELMTQNLENLKQALN